jgi:hypothetical protein
MFSCCHKNNNLSTVDKSIQISTSTHPPPPPPPSPSQSQSSSSSTSTSTQTDSNSKNNNINNSFSDCNDQILHEHLNKLVDLNIKYNIEFNIITNEINKIKLSRENKEVFELDVVRKYTPVKIYSSGLDEEIKIIKIRARGISAPPQLFKNIENVSYV